MICPSNYYTLFFITLLIDSYNDRFLPLLREFLLIPDRNNKFTDLRANCSFPALINSAGIWSIPGDFCLSSFLVAISTSKALGSALVALQYLRKMVPPAKQNIVGVCKQVTLLIIYSIVLGFLNHWCSYTSLWYFLYFSFKFINLSLQIFLPFFSGISARLRLTLFSVSTLLWFGSYNHCILARFLWAEKPQHSSSNMANATSIHTDLDCLELRFWYFL